MFNILMSGPRAQRLASRSQEVKVMTTQITISDEVTKASAAHAKVLGYSIDLEMFEGSSHVGHMRLHPEQYWNKVAGSWKQAMEKK